MRPQTAWPSSAPEDSAGCLRSRVPATVVTRSPGTGPRSRVRREGARFRAESAEWTRVPAQADDARGPGGGARLARLCQGERRSHGEIAPQRADGMRWRLWSPLCGAGQSMSGPDVRGWARSVAIVVYGIGYEVRDCGGLWLGVGAPPGVSPLPTGGQERTGVLAWPWSGVGADGSFGGDSLRGERDTR